MLHAKDSSDGACGALGDTSAVSGVVGERIRTALNNYPKAVPQALTPAPLQRKECFGGGVICPSGAMREDSLKMDEWGGQL
jgi:hypothetical protein